MKYILPFVFALMLTYTVVFIDVNENVYGIIASLAMMLYCYGTFQLILMFNRNNML